MNFPYDLIDLTHTIDERTCTWEGGCGFKPEIISDYDNYSNDVEFRIMTFQMNAGIGTHMDAPSHCIRGASSIHHLSLSELCMPCVVIDVREKAHEHYSVSVDDIVSFENDYGSIGGESCVMIRTGWERFWGEPNKYRNNLVFPSVSLDAAQLLLERNVCALGIDTLSPDRPEDGYQVHQAFLGRGKILIENVAHLGLLPMHGAFVMALPIKVKDATEAPIRLIGMVEPSPITTHKSAHS